MRVSDYLERLINWETAMMLCIFGGVAVLARKWIARWLRLSGGGLFFTTASLVGIFAFTFRVWEGNGTSDTFWAFDGFAWTQLNRSFGNGFLNMALFVPAAACLVLNGKKWFFVIPSLALLSAFIETAQTFTRWGVGDPADFVANIWGAVIGCLLAGICLGVAGLVRHFR